MQRKTPELLRNMAAEHNSLVAQSSDYLLDCINACIPDLNNIVSIIPKKDKGNFGKSGLLLDSVEGRSLYLLLDGSLAEVVTADTGDRLEENCTLAEAAIRYNAEKCFDSIFTIMKKGIEQKKSEISGIEKKLSGLEK